MGVLCTKVMYLSSFFRDKFQLLSLGKIWLYRYLHQDCVRELVWVCFGGFSPRVWRGGVVWLFGFFPQSKLSTRISAQKNPHSSCTRRSVLSWMSVSLVFGITPFPHKVVGGRVGRGDCRVAEEKRKAQSRGKDFKGWLEEERQTMTPSYGKRLDCRSMGNQGKLNTKNFVGS